MVRHWQRWAGIFLLLGAVVILGQGGCLDMGGSDNNNNTGNSGGPGTGGGSYVISGRVMSNGSGLANVSMTISGGTSDSVNTTSNGNFTFSVNNGNYILTPSLSGYSFSPGSMALSINNSNWNGVNFNATSTGVGGGGTTYTLSGTVTGIGSGATVILSGPSSASTMTDGNGNYSFTGVANGNYTVSASKAGFTVTPNNRNITISGSNQTSVNFTGSTYSGTTYTVSGRVATSASVGVADVMITANGPIYMTVFTNPDGYYTFNNIQSGNYNIMVSKEGYYFDTNNVTVYVSGNMTDQDIVATLAQENTYTIYGQLHGDGNLASNQMVNLSGPTSRSTSTDPSGFYSFEGLNAGTYTVAPYIYMNGQQVNTVPQNRDVTITSSDSYGNDFDVASTFSISGNITYNGSKQGVMFIFVLWDGGSQSQWGTAIPWMGPGGTTRPYTIRGVKPGSYKISAMLDDSIGNFNAARNANDPTGISSTVNVNGNVTSANVTVTNPSPVFAMTPTNVIVSPGDGGFLMFWDAPEDSNEFELASAYNVYWGTSPNINNTNFSGTGVAPAKNDAHFFASGLTNGDLYYFAVEAVTNAGISSPSTVVSATIGAPAGGSTVSGTVTLVAGDLSVANRMLYVGMYSEDKNNTTIYLSSGYQIASTPPTSIAYSIPGVADGTYMLFYIVDINSNGVIDSGDYTNTNDNGSAGAIAVSGANLANQNLTVSNAKAVAYISTNHQRDTENGDNYGVELGVSAGRCTPITVTLLSGPNVSGPEDLGKEWSFRSWIGFGSAQPNSGDTYTFDVGFADGTSLELTATVAGVLDAFAQNLNVTTGLTPTLSWTAPANPPAHYGYAVRVSEVVANPNGGTYEQGVWETDNSLPSSQLLVVYNSDGNGQALQAGHNYKWQVYVYDLDTRNSAGISATFSR
ncbi:MAG: carboxypeptidase regulatory-like domain-containing protein [Planctomycetota bacterium]